jgi:hypothetical protein
LYRALNEAGRWQAEINRILTANPRLRMHAANRITQRRRRPEGHLALWGQSRRSTVIRSRTVPQARLTVKTILKIRAGILLAGTIAIVGIGGAASSPASDQHADAPTPAQLQRLHHGMKRSEVHHILAPAKAHLESSSDSEAWAPRPRRPTTSRTAASGSARR